MPRSSVATISSPPSYEDLPKRQREFIESYVRTGDALQSYLSVGYKDSKAAKNNAIDLRRRLHHYIGDAVSRYARSNDLAILGLRALSDLVSSAESEGVKLAAAKELVRLTVPDEPKEVTVNHNHTVAKLTDEQIDRRLAQLHRELTEKDVTPE